MVAPVPFTLSRPLEAVVDAFVQELTAARREIVIVRAATAVERGDLEATLADAVRERDALKAQLIEARGEVQELRARQPVSHIVDLVDLTPPAPTPALAHPLKPPGVPLGPPNNPRLSGYTTLVGHTFGTWEVLARGASGGSGMTYWKCRCVKCGSTKELAGFGAYSLRGNHVPWCPACRASKKPKAAARAATDEDGDDGEGDDA
jgi:hypothetical protein